MTLEVVSGGYRSGPSGPPEDTKAWGIAFEAVDEALGHRLTPDTRERLVRCRRHLGQLAMRPLVTKAGDA